MQRMSQNQSLISNCQVEFIETTKYPIPISGPKSDKMDNVKYGSYENEKELVTINRCMLRT